MSHPLLLAALALDLAATGLVLAAALPALKALLDWRPGAADPAQLALERRLEAGALQARLAFGLFAGASLLWILAVASVLPPLVPGAMCGTGVVSALGGAGGRALLLRAGALGLLGAWSLTHRLDRSRPDGPATLAAARALLLATPAVLLGALDTFGAFSRLDTHTAVDCCAVVYDATRASGGLLAAAAPAHWLWATAALSAPLLALSALALRRAPGPRTTRALSALALLAPLWALSAGGALILHLAAYRYEVLAHHCPWCLFLADHGRVGYPLFGALLLAALEGPALALAGALARSHPALAPAAARRRRRAALHLLLGLITYAALALGPALAWRLRHGAWLG